MLHLVEHHQSGKHTEADHVSEGVQLLAERGIGLQASCCDAVERVEQRCGEHHPECGDEISLHRIYNAKHPRNEVQECYGIGNMFLDVHVDGLFDAELLLDVLRKRVLVHHDVHGLVPHESVGSVPDTVVLAGVTP